MRIPVDLKYAYRLLNHGPTTLLTSSYQDKKNVMAAAWVMAIDFVPPKVLAIISADTYTKQLVAASGQFVVNVPTVAQVDLTYAVGQVSGADIDKFITYNIQTSASEKSAAPLIDGCVAWLECRLIPESHLQNAYDGYIGEVVAASADDEVFTNGRWDFANAPYKKTIHHISAGHFFVSGDIVKASR